VAQKFHFAVLQIEVTRASRGLSATAELLVNIIITVLLSSKHWSRCYADWTIGYFCFRQMALPKHTLRTTKWTLV